MDGPARLLEAYSGVPVEPVPAGITYLPPEALAGWASPAADGAAAILAAFAARHACDFAFVPADAVWASDAPALLAEEGVACLWSVTGPLGGVMREAGATETLKATFADPDALDARLGREFDRVSVDLSEGVSLGASAVVVAEDLAGSAGLLVDPEYVRGRLIPSLRSLAGIAAELGVPAALHSDGDIEDLLPDIAAAGFAAVHLGGLPDAAAFERLFWSARSSGLAVIGGISAAQLSAGGPAAVLAGAAAGVLATAGGLLVADDGGLVSHEQAGLLGDAIAAARGSAVLGSL